jgi:hypothetical protein
MEQVIGSDGSDILLYLDPAAEILDLGLVAHGTPSS